MTNKDKILEELKKCREDPIYFITRYVKIDHPVKGRIPFELFRFQQRIVNEVHNHRFNIVRKFRQAGVTTIMAAYSLHMIIFERHRNILCVSIGDREAKAFLNRVVKMYDELPVWLKPKVTERNKSTLELSTGSKIKSQPAGAGRSESASIIVVDEAAFVKDFEEFWQAVFPTVSTGGKAFLISTVNGTANLYYQLYQNAIQGKNEFNAIDIRWQEHPDYTEEWAKSMKSSMPERSWLQEYECEFLGTGDTFVDGNTLRKLSHNISEEFSEKFTRAYRVWKDPEPYHQYALSVDPAYGRGRDNTAFHIIDLYSGEQVAEFCSNTISVKKLAKVIYDEGNRYNLAYVIIERNALGIVLFEELFHELAYENIYMDDKGQFGIQTTKVEKEKALAHMEDSLRRSLIKVNSNRLVDELGTFVVKENKIEAEKGYNDDLVMSLALGCYAIKDILENSPVTLDKKEAEQESLAEKIFRSEYQDKTDRMKEYRKWVLS